MQLSGDDCTVLDLRLPCCVISPQEDSENLDPDFQIERAVQVSRTPSPSSPEKVRDLEPCTRSSRRMKSLKQTETVRFIVSNLENQISSRNLGFPLRISIPYSLELKPPLK